jgi:GT2 family glycosyltransferase
MKKTSPPHISIIVLNWNGKEDTLECLASLQAVTYPAFDIIVADNGSTDNSVEAIHKTYPDVHVLENGTNLGFAEGNNRAIRFALKRGADAVVILNNDTIVDPNLLQAFYEAYISLPDAGILGATCLYYDQPEIIWTAGAEWNSKTLEFSYLYQGCKYTEIPYKTALKVPYIIGCVMFIHKKVIKDIGLMNPVYFLNFEELDWCIKISSVGYQNYTISRAKIWHKIASSFGGKNSPLKNYFLTRNFLLWAKWHAPNELTGILKMTICEFIPPVSFLYPSHSKTLKQSYWEFIDWYKQCKSRAKDPYYLAQAYGIYHYFLHKFGDCPPKLKARLTQKTD